ncbi:MAG: VTT domain-containing protein [Actinomycetes bacterium]
MIATTYFQLAASIQTAGLLDPEGLLKGFGSLALFAACLILFIECGLLVGVILPGDSLLFIVGMLIASNFISTPLSIALLLMSICAIAGNLLGYWTGAKIGPKLFSRPDSKLFKQEYVVTTQNFFEKHGSRAIVLARFVPIVRSVITALAGVARMDYKTYATYSTIGGILWICTMTLAGYFLGSIPVIKENIDLVAIGIVLLSLIPVFVEVIRQRRKS